jgi:hypothetical protein
VTPDPSAALSTIDVATRLDRSNRAINPDDAFVSPSGVLYGAFTYNFMQDGVRWTAIWYRGSQIVCLESQPWDGGTGGFGYTECDPQQGWQAGNYEIQMFVGTQWKVSARFEVLTGTATPTPTFTSTQPVDVGPSATLATSSPPAP